MNKGDKIIYTYFYHPFDIGFEIGYYLFSDTQQEGRYHFVTTNQSLVEKVMDDDMLLSSLEKGTVNKKNIAKVFEYNIRPFSQVLAKKTEQTYSFFESHKDEFELFLSISSEPKRLRKYYMKIEKFSLSYPRIVLDYYFAKSRYYFRKITDYVLLPFRIITFEIRSVFTLYKEYTERETALRNREKNENPLAYHTEDEERIISVEINELRKSKETAREVLLKSNRAIIGFVLAIIAFSVPYCFSKRTELLLNERINNFQRENQFLKEEAKSLNSQLMEQQRANNLLQKKIEDMKKTSK